MSFAPRHAAVTGAMTGALSGAAITLIMGITLSEALIRIAVLAFAAMLGGIALVWLDQGLRKVGSHAGEQSHR